MMERCGKCGMVEESSIHDINSPDIEIRRVAHHFELVAPCPQCALKDADLATANTQLAEKDAEAKRLREVIEWALSQADCFNEKMLAELRRRADTVMKRGKE